MVAKIAQSLENLAQPLVIADIVADEIGVAHGWNLKSKETGPTLRGNCECSPAGVQCKDFYLHILGGEKAEAEVGAVAEC
jgi:hypothetical protein